MTEKSKKITEIEIKAYVTDIALIRRKLLELGSKDIGNFEYDDVYFVPSDESKKCRFLENEEEYRIRNIKKSGKFLKLIKTYKRPVSGSNKKTKREWETADYDPTDLVVLEEEMSNKGYIRYVKVKKAGYNFSIEYKYKKNETTNETFHLDLTLSKVEHCGCFLEIECPISSRANGLERQIAYDVIYYFLFEIGLDKNNIELRYYTELVRDYMQRVKSGTYSYLCESLLEKITDANADNFSLNKKIYLLNYLLETGYLKVLKDTHGGKSISKYYLYLNWSDTMVYTKARKFINYIKKEFQSGKIDYF